jgi:hypothetical protein
MTRAKNILTETYEKMFAEHYWPDCTDMSYALALQLRDVIKEIDIETEKFERMTGGDTNAQKIVETHQKAPTSACDGLGKGQGQPGATKEQGGAVAPRIAPTPCTH